MRISVGSLQKGLIWTEKYYVYFILEDMATRRRSRSTGRRTKRKTTSRRRSQTKYTPQAIVRAYKAGVLTETSRKVRSPSSFARSNVRGHWQNIRRKSDRQPQRRKEANEERAKAHAQQVEERQAIKVPQQVQEQVPKQVPWREEVKYRSPVPT